MFEPTNEEELTLEAALGIDIPTREEMQAIELSSRLYEENGVLLHDGDGACTVRHDPPESAAITFILRAR